MSLVVAEQALKAHRTKEIPCDILYTEKSLEEGMKRINFLQRICISY